MTLMNSGIYATFVTSVLIHLQISVTSYNTFENKETNLTAAVGGHVVLKCQEDFSQIAHVPFNVIWRKDRKRFFSYYMGVIQSSEPFVGRINLIDENATRFGDVSVNLTSVRITDEGWYECKVFFPNRTPSSSPNGTWIHLIVTGNDLIIIPPVNQTVTEGQEARFDCATKNSTFTVKWFKEEQLVESIDQLRFRYWITVNNTLIIRPTHMNDIGEYYCEISNPSDGHSQVVKAFLNVQYKAKVVFAPAYIHLPYGRRAVLDCHFRANPPLTNLRWEKDGFLYDAYNVQGVFYRRNGSLFFTKVAEEHSGEYTCTPFNELGSQGPSSIIHVVVQKPPVFTVTPRNLYLKRLGESVQMACEAYDTDHRYKAEIAWYRKDRKPFPLDRHNFTLDKLTIFNIQPIDEGIYVCQAANSAANITTETELKLERSLPSVPYNLSASATLTSVRLTWLTDDPNGTITYSVWYRIVDQFSWNTTDHIGRNGISMQATVYNLTPGTQYEFIILCRQMDSIGAFSKSIKLWTQNFTIDHAENSDTNNGINSPFSSLSSPSNITISPSINGLLVSWEPPSYGVEAVKHYIVQWTKDGQEHDRFNSETTTNTTFLIIVDADGEADEGIANNVETTYRIQIVAVSFNESQSVSRLITFSPPMHSQRVVQAISNGALIGFAITVCLFLLVAIRQIKRKRLQRSSNSGSAQL